MKDKLEKICLHKYMGCELTDVCDGQGNYKLNNQKEKCDRVVYKQIDLWRTDYMTVRR